MSAENHAKLIDDLGGNAGVVTLLQAVHEAQTLTTTHVSNWRRRGIPWHYRHTIKTAAESRGLTVPAGFMQKKG